MLQVAHTLEVRRSSLPVDCQQIHGQLVNRRARLNSHVARMHFRHGQPITLLQSASLISPSVSRNSHNQNAHFGRGCYSFSPRAPFCFVLSNGGDRIPQLALAFDRKGLSRHIGIRTTYPQWLTGIMPPTSGSESGQRLMIACRLIVTDAEPTFS
jgi:hypothetical protein